MYAGILTGLECAYKWETDCMGIRFSALIYTTATYLLLRGSFGTIVVSGGTSTRKLELSVAGASDPSTRVKKLIARKLLVDDILIAQHMLPMHVRPSDGQNSPLCTRFPEIKCVFLCLRDRCVICHFLGHRFSIAAVHRMSAWHVPTYAEAQCCYKSFALRSFGRKTR